MVSAGVQPVAPGSETDPYLRLADGVVRAVALVYAPAEIQADAADAGRPAVFDHDGAPGAVAGLAVSGPQAAGPAAQEAVREEVPQAAPAPPPEPKPAQQPEPEYYATQVEPVASAPYPPEVQPPALDPYAPEAQQQVPDPYAPDPADGGAARPDLMSVPLAPGELGGEVPDHAPLPLGDETPNDLGPVEGAEMVEGVYCENGHFNDPEARSCAVCDISIGPLAKVRQQGPRPPLGVLLLGDGSVCQLDADYVIGREPTLDSAVAEGRARPLRVNDTSGVVSRIHARVELDGWQVFITDLKSANGTEVLLPGDRNPTSLQPGVRLPLMAGTQIRLGGEYGLQYDSHRQQ